MTHSFAVVPFFSQPCESAAITSVRNAFNPCKHAAALEDIKQNTFSAIPMSKGILPGNGKTVQRFCRFVQYITNRNAEEESTATLLGILSEVLHV